jgi:hypothetical protein
MSRLNSASALLAAIDNAPEAVRLELVAMIDSRVSMYRRPRTVKITHNALEDVLVFAFQTKGVRHVDAT